MLELQDGVCEKDDIAFEDDVGAEQSRCLELVTQRSLYLVKHETRDKSQSGAGVLLVDASLAVNPTDAGEIRLRKEVEFAPIASALIYCGCMMAMAMAPWLETEGLGFVATRLPGDQFRSHVRHFQQEHLSKADQGRFPPWCGGEDGVRRSWRPRLGKFRSTLIQLEKYSRLAARTGRYAGLNISLRLYYNSSALGSTTS